MKQNFIIFRMQVEPFVDLPFGYFFKFCHVSTDYLLGTAPDPKRRQKKSRAK